MGGDERLVAGDDIGARVQGELDVLARGMDAAHQLDHDVGADDEPLSIRREEFAREVCVARRVDVAHRDADEVECRAGAVGELVLVGEQQRSHLRPHGAGAQQGDAEAAVVGHADSFPAEVARDEAETSALTPRSRARRSSIVSPRTITRAVPRETATTGGRGT